MPSDLATLEAPPAAAGERRAPARLLEYRRGRFAALPAHATVELVERAPLVEVPGAPYYCSGLMRWQGRLLPVLDLHVLLRAYPDGLGTVHHHVLVVAWQAAPRQPLAYGALWAPELVQMIEVGDSQQCPLPTDSDLWPYIAISCFRHGEHVVPVLDTARLFGQPHD